MHSFTLLSALALAAFLLAATISDVRARRIPNALVAAGMITALVLHVLAPVGDGLFSAQWGSLGLAQPFFGLLTGLAIFMPLYLFRAVGAGDVKLLAMAGAWLGPLLVLGAALLTLVAGGLLALAVMVATRSSRQVLVNVRVMLTTAMIGALAGRPGPLDAPMANGVRLPYALAITVGTLAQVGWQLVHSSP
jgi:prepilin peptidase CpaA